MKWTKGLGRMCERCNMKTGTQENCVEVDGKVYHQKCKPTQARKEVVQASLRPGLAVAPPRLIC